MVLKALRSIWKFLEQWGEMKYEFNKRHNFNSWY